jgi:nucleoside-diphosphate-sugar epimerase
MGVLVSGGNRYIGMRLLFELASQGHEVSVANSHLAEMPEGTRRIHVDRTVPGTLTEVLGPHRDDFDAVFDNTAYLPWEPQMGLESAYQDSFEWWRDGGRDLFEHDFSGDEDLLAQLA